MRRRGSGSGRRFYSDSYLAGPWGALLFVGLMVVVCYGVIQLIRKADETAEADKKQSASKASLGGKSGGPRFSTGSGEPRKGNATSTTQTLPKASIQQAVNELNVAVVSREVARYRADAGNISKFTASANTASSRLASVASGEANLPEHLETGDEIIMLDGVDLTKMKEDDAAALLVKVIQKKTGGNNYRIRVRRGAERDLNVWFPSEAGLAGGGFTSSGRVRISNEMTLEIQKQVLSLPDQMLGISERQQIEKILGRGEATPEEYEVLTRRLAGDAAGGIERERDSFKAQLAALEKLLPDGPVQDTLLTRDGRRIAGAIGSETESAVTMDTSFGKVTVARKEIGHLYTVKELREEFQRRLEGVKQRPEATPQLLVWTRDWQLPVQREYVAYLMLQLNSEDRLARAAAGYYQGQGGKWVLGNSIASGGKPEIKRPSNRAEMQSELERLGFALHGGKWHTRAAWTAGIDSLHSPGGVKIALSGCLVIPWHESDTPEGRLFNPSGKPKDGSAPRLRFIGPAGQTGTVTLTVEAPGEILECQVKATGNVIERQKQGKVECFITPDGATTQPLYSIDQASDERFHDVTSLVRGKKRFQIGARLTTTVDKYQAYSRFLQSLPDAKEVFWVKAVILQPAPEIDKTWAATRP